MIGDYRYADGRLTFVPRFPLEAGIKYKAVLNASDGSLSSGYLIPAKKIVPSTVVSQIYPSAELLPENTLKFYVHFSAPMGGGGIYEHVRLLDNSGKAIELPFLELGEELWDPTMTRLTLFIDPGRIKRGVKPLEDIGPALVEGQKFTLAIARSAKDAQGAELKQGFEKRFTVGPADRNTPDPARWAITAPKAATRQPLTVEFGESMDHALALRMIVLLDETGKEVAGTPALEQHERRWIYTPDQAWRGGRYNLTVLTTIEDLAGNNIGKPFDVDIFENVQRSLTAPSVSVPVEIR